MKITGTHTHATLGLFSYSGEYTTSQPQSTWFVDWHANAVGAGGVVQLSGGGIEILGGGPGAAQLLVEKRICAEIDALA